MHAYCANSLDIFTSHGGLVSAVPHCLRCGADAVVLAARTPVVADHVSGGGVKSNSSTRIWMGALKVNNIKRFKLLS